MDLMESPLNRAHQCGRKASRLVVQECYEEAISCHGEAADLLKEAILITQNEQVKLSLELQRGRHVQQQRLIRDTWKRGKMVRKPPISSTKPGPPPPPAQSPPTTQSPPTAQPPPTAQSPPTSRLTAGQTAPQYISPAPLRGFKAAKDDKTRLEEQSTAMADLRKVIAVLLLENEKLLEENQSLKLENARLIREAFVDQQSSRLTPPLNPAEVTSTGAADFTSAP